MPKGKRKTKEHITPGNGNTHVKNEQELDETRKVGPEQSELENAGRRAMLHFESIEFMIIEIGMKVTRIIIEKEKKEEEKEKKEKKKKEEEKKKKKKKKRRRRK
ncbi:unnamed protein product [Schistosoma margrebowiei]|uniref:Uncharacterized protein n=1 Tax=Schistosoma margrebowiei TaxID=48269 RepID=A0A183LIX2_9TREM|nr:unnamed protein product [Schistosoma margrebowiei]